MTGSKVLMVRQRLAPQHPFPAALLDVFMAYLALLAPPPGSPHEAISPTSIVLAGDSSGSNLVLSLLQSLLQLDRQNATIKFHGQIVKPIMPAGAALLSVVADLTNSFPSYQRNVASDVFPYPIENLPYLRKDFPTCTLWPTQPARANIYCEAGMLAHPLVSPVACRDWTGCCPLWFASGEEQVVDASRLLAQTAYAQGVTISLQEYEGMPHSFYFAFPTAPQSKKVLADWAKAIVDLARGLKLVSRASFIQAKGLQPKELDITALVPFSVDEARGFMWKQALTYKVPSFHKQGTSLL